jgi:hypothetical protein
LRIHGLILPQIIQGKQWKGRAGSGIGEKPLTRDFLRVLLPDGPEAGDGAADHTGVNALAITTQTGRLLVFI